MILSLGVTPRNFYYIMVDEFSQFFNLGLTRGESKTLAELMFAYYEVRNYKEEDKESAVMSVDNKKRLIVRIGTTSAAFNNTLSRLRKKIGKKGPAIIDNKINPEYMIYPDEKFTFTLKFVIDDRFKKEK